MNSRFSYALVGLFVLILGAVLAWSVVWFSTNGITGDYSRYVIYLEESVSGLSVDSPVRYNGVKVGGITEIRIDPDNPRLVRVIISVSDDAPVKTDTVAILKTQGLTGIAHINLTGGSPDAPPLEPPPGRPYPVIESRPSVFARVEDQAGLLLENLTETSRLLNQLLSPENQQYATRILAHLEALSANLASQSQAVAAGVRDFNAALENVRASSEQLPELTRQIRQSAKSIDTMAETLAEASRTISRQLDETAPEIGRFTRQTLPDATALVHALRRTAENLQQISTELRQDPSILLYGAPKPAAGPGE